jgi:DNA-binding MarR family transcriptional regulator
MTKSLRDAVFLSLTPRGRELLEQIETYAGQPVNFALYPYPPRPNSTNPTAPAAEISHDSGTIYIHGTEPQHLSGVPHELLHIRRNWCDEIPQLHPKVNDQRQLTLCGNVDNTLEHLVIVPQEAEYGADNSDHWKQIARAKWQGYPWPHVDIKDQAGRRGNALLGRLELELVPDAEITALAARGLACEGLTEEAERFASRVKQLLANKPRVLSCAVRFLRWPRDKVHLVYFDIRRKLRRTEPLPAH